MGFEDEQTTPGWKPECHSLRVYRRGHEVVTFYLEPNVRYSFGRTSQAKVLFPDVRVSRMHGYLEMLNGLWSFMDVGSANNSYLFNGYDLTEAEREDRDLPCHKLRRAFPAAMRPGQGILLGTRDCWIELFAGQPPGTLPNLIGVNPPSVLAMLGLAVVSESPTPDLLEMPEPAVIHPYVRKAS